MLLISVLCERLSIMKLFVVDRIVIFSLLRLNAPREKTNAIWYFEPLERYKRRWIKRFERLSFFHWELRQVEHYVGEIRGDAGESEYVETGQQT